MFIVESVRFKNFNSYGEQFTTVSLTRNQATVITGKNGHGKTTILQAIEFGLFGKVSSSGKPKGELVNTINKKDCVVEVWCSVDGKRVFVRRGIKPDVFEIVVDGELLKQDGDVRDYQKRFEEVVLGFNANSFKQVVSISGATYEPFMRLSTPDRRKFVESLLNLSVFSEMGKVHTREVSINKDAIRDTESAIDKASDTIVALKKGLETVSTQKDQVREEEERRIAAQEAEIKLKTAEIDRLSAEIEGLNAQYEVSALESKRKRKDTLTDFGRDIASKVRNLEDFIKLLESNDTCPTCHQDIDSGFRASEVASRRAKADELATSLDSLREKLRTTNADITAMESVFDSIRELRNKIKLEDTAIATIRKQIANINQSLTSFKQSDNSDALRTEIVQKHELLLRLKDERLALLEDKQYNDLISTIIKDNGIKASVIKQYIPRMNQTINQFIELLELPVSFSMDETFNETILSRFTDKLSYSAYSAGEKARIDIAILFTWREIARMKNSLKCNLLFLDETFDSQLDEQGIEAFVNLLQRHMEDTNVFLITHKAEAIEKFQHQMRISKCGNFSRIEP